MLASLAASSSFPSNKPFYRTRFFSYIITLIVEKEKKIFFSLEKRKKEIRRKERMTKERQRQEEKMDTRKETEG